MALFTDLIDNIKGLFIDHININGYVFDAMLRMRQTQRLEVTKNPVETGVDISDHAFLRPREFQFDIGMTDTTLGKVAGQFGLLNRSITAFEILSELQRSRQPVTLNGKYGFYDNLLITNIEPIDDYTTYNALRVSVTLEEIITSTTQIVEVSANGSLTSSTNRGTQAAQEVNENVSSLVTLGVPAGYL